MNRVWCCWRTAAISLCSTAVSTSAVSSPSSPFSADTWTGHLSPQRHMKYCWTKEQASLDDDRGPLSVDWLERGPTRPIVQNRGCHTSIRNLHWHFRTVTCATVKNHSCIVLPVMMLPFIYSYSEKYSKLLRWVRRLQFPANLDFLSWTNLCFGLQQYFIWEYSEEISEFRSVLWVLQLWLKKI